MSDLKKLFNTMPQVGTVDWIGLRPSKKAILEEAKEIQITEADGIVGDHYTGKSKKRQVTLIQAEHLATVASVLKMDSINPQLTRRNIVISGINLLALKEQQFRIGSAILETTGLCHPCSRMEENLGAGGYNAMRGHGGITTKVIKDGVVKLGDTVELIPIISSISL